MTAYRDMAPRPEQLLVCCGTCPARTEDGGYGCKYRVGVCYWNEVHPAGLSYDHPEGTGVRVNDGTDDEWLTVKQMKAKRDGSAQGDDDDE